MRNSVKSKLFLSIIFLLLTLIFLFYLFKVSPFKNIKQERLSLVNKDVLRLDNNLTFAKKVESFNITNDKKQ